MSPDPNDLPFLSNVLVSTAFHLPSRLPLLLSYGCFTGMSSGITMLWKQIWYYPVKWRVPPHKDSGALEHSLTGKLAARTLKDVHSSNAEEQEDSGNDSDTH